MKKLLAIIFALVLTTACNDDKEELIVYADSSLTAVMREITQSYCEGNNSVNLILTTDASNKLTNRISINKGNYCDVYIPMTLKQTETLITNGYLNESNVAPFLKNRVVLVQHIDSPHNITSLDTITNANSIAIAKEGVPIGDFAREALTNANKYADVIKTMKVKEYDNDVNLINAIIKGGIDVAMVYATDVLQNRDTLNAIIEAPDDTINTPIIYPLALINESSIYGENFIAYLKSDTALSIFKKHGFELDSSLKAITTQKDNTTTTTED